ncbi:hypothetical protein SB7C_12190 [Staphylococcus epidermidis]|nr:hypothetical protein SB7C_12190 [Staphylococcus epidermidis]
MRSTAPRWFAAALAVTCCPDVPRSGVAALPNGIAGNSLQFAHARTNRANDAGPAGQNSNAVRRPVETRRQRRDSRRGVDRTMLAARANALK